MNINNAFPSKWIKSGDLEAGDQTLTIKSLKFESVERDDNAAKKPVIYFQEIAKGLVLNRTNAEILSELHTPETENWVGKKITLYATQADFMGRPTLAVRIRLHRVAPRANGTSSGDLSANHPSYISVEQRRQLFDVAKQNGWSDEDMRTGLGSLGFETTATIPEAAFQKVVSLFTGAPLSGGLPF